MVGIEIVACRSNAAVEKTKQIQNSQKGLKKLKTKMKIGSTALWQRHYLKDTDFLYRQWGVPHGGDKSTQKKDIKTAHAYWADYLRRKDQ
jgi:hypothetical protein